MSEKTPDTSGEESTETYVPFADVYDRLGAIFDFDRTLDPASPLKISEDGVCGPLIYQRSEPGAPEEPPAYREARALRQGCGLVDASAEDLLALRGEDRVRFLNGQVTCDVSALTEGRGTYGFFTTGKGRVEFDLRLLDLGDRLWLAVAPGRGPAVQERLARYVIVDRVAFETPEYRSIRLVGPSAAQILAELAGVEPSELPAEPWSHRQLELAGTSVRVLSEPDLVVPEDEGESALAIPRLALWLPIDGHEAVIEALVEAGAWLVGHWAWHRLRVAAGLPLFGVDFGLDSFPQETGLEDWAVSYTKGCYLGQEVVARIHYRGGVRRAMRRVVADTGLCSVDPERRLGGRLYAQADGKTDGKEMGMVTSAEHREGGGWIGLAIVRLEVEPGSELILRSVLDGDEEPESGPVRIEELRLG